MPSLTADLEAAARIGADPRGGVSRFAWTPELARGERMARGAARRARARGRARPGRQRHRPLAGGRGHGGAPRLPPRHRAERRSLRRRARRARGARRRPPAEGRGRRAAPAASGSSPSTTRRAGASRRGCSGAGLSAATATWRTGAGRGVARGDGRGRASTSPGSRTRAGVDGVGAYLELHIEQGPVLERAGTDLGVVTAITGMLGFRARFLGEANHAGTTPMELRRDALAGAARAVLALRDEARSRDDMTANVGVITAEPGGFNVVPGRRRADRSTSARRPRRASPASSRSSARRWSGSRPRRSSASSSARPTASEPVALDAGLAGPARGGGARGGREHALACPSGAGHDAHGARAPRPGGDALRPQPRRPQPHARRVLRAGHCELGARVLARAVRVLVG